MPMLNLITSLLRRRLGGETCAGFQRHHGADMIRDSRRSTLGINQQRARGLIRFGWPAPRARRTSLFDQYTCCLVRVLE